MRVERRQIDGARNFFERGRSVHNAPHGIMRQKAHALLCRDTTQLAQRGPPRHQFIQIGIEAHHFHERNSPMVSLLLAIVAANRLVQGFRVVRIESQQAPLGGAWLVVGSVSDAVDCEVPLPGATPDVKLPRLFGACGVGASGTP